MHDSISAHLHYFYLLHNFICAYSLLTDTRSIIKVKVHPKNYPKQKYCTCRYGKRLKVQVTDAANGHASLPIRIVLQDQQLRFQNFDKVTWIPVIAFRSRIHLSSSYLAAMLFLPAGADLLQTLKLLGRNTEIKMTCLCSRYSQISGRF